MLVEALFQAAVEGDLETVVGTFLQLSTTPTVVDKNVEHRQERASVLAMDSSPFKYGNAYSESCINNSMSSSGSSHRLHAVSSQTQCCGVDMRGEPGELSPLHKAVDNSNVEIAEVLITYGFADVNARGPRGLTPLMLAANCSVASLLVDYGADPRLCDSSRSTVMHFASEGRTGLDLLEYFASLAPDLVNDEDDNDMTPLWHVIRNARTYVTERLEILLSHGAGPYQKNCHGFSVYRKLMASNSGYKNIAARPQFFPVQMEVHSASAAYLAEA
ncbi:hypothetical protein Poli38472_012292 [Pythium oligandrum]|uniref:Uncharacterized protein n=1 Tax=Pythium oligandrum TaxID=41045 RepID=A0A8K1CP13_PYTOL|nr:hypothetical protein Poli38472_012292 [Pythium oligandrum]|eukprot:TMW67176.1 hypothetical protein Poli38472_012292 [Pythium oligandrum]